MMIPKLDCRNILPNPRPADWGLKVSVCIALLCNHDKTLVTITDRKVNFGNYSADDVATKEWPIHRNCSVLYAGNDIEHAAPILNRAQILTASNFKNGISLFPDKVLVETYRPSPELMADALDQAFVEQLHREIEAKVLRKRGFNVESFRENGKQKCTPSVYLSLCSRIDQVDISLEFIVCGFDGEGQGHILCVDGKGAPRNYDPIGMWAIGSGAHAAMSWLAFHADRKHFHRYSSVSVGVYYALTAKFMAETAGDVGRNTFVIISEANQELKHVPPKGERAIREFWESNGTPPNPDGIEDNITSYIADIEDE